MKLITAIFILLTLHVSAQVTLPVARNIQAAFNRDTRSNTGQPGSRYWQNRAAYKISINFNPATRLISGTVDINYYNQSPDTLKEIVFKLYPNLYKAGAMRVYPVEEQDVSKGMAIEKLSVNNQPQDAGEAIIQGTNMTVPVPPLFPSQQIHFTIEYSYTLNKTSHIRTGEIEEGAYFIAYSFPRITVYDDVDGWNRNEYLGTYEFYHDFCDFNVDISVPTGYAVWATGDLKNCSEVYTPAICSRITTAETKDDIVTIIDSQNLQQKDFTVAKPINTFRFEAKQVTDFAFAISNHYTWQSTSLVVDSATGRRTRVDAVYNPMHTDYTDVIAEARKTVELMSFQFPKWPYPYSHETVFDGLDKMEYPMMVNDVPQHGALASFSLTSHEIFHTMFPFYMGINETKYGWMDEGWATIGEWLLTPIYLPGIIDSFAMAGYESAAGKEIDLPIMTPTTQLQGIYYEEETAFSINSYPKPALGYLYVKDMLGDELFIKALHHYIKTWNGKHPLPYDFFNCINQAAGVNLNWFWKRWFFDAGYPDLGITNVTAKQVTIASKGSKPVPIDLTLHFTDNTTQSIHRTIAVWQQGNTTVTLPLPAAKKITKIELGSFYNADVDKSDNFWVGK
ncbi:M1 family metallopeptidase [Foetidibacter luteolus]|uniref:M1 family metallopeptidase n=1 Tax=Foetidibacter luteolus TaxID=2608880 RepID=UPI00129ADF83|nr:M1 family metallopeptidase [Foetidibacter luteolus]